MTDLPPDDLPVASQNGESTGLGPSVAQRDVVRPDARRVWPMVILIIYGLVLVAMPCVATYCAVGSSYEEILFWAIVALVVILLSGGLLLLPVRVATRRPVARGSLWLTLLAGGGLAAGLAIGVWGVMADLVESEHIASSQPVLDALVEPAGIVLFCLAILVWPVWTIIFARMDRDRGVIPRAEKMSAWLLRGSILELLIAVPSHLWVRRKDECSIGLPSGAAIVVGSVVAFIAFGPSLILLYAERIGRLRPFTDAQSRRPRFWLPIWICTGCVAIAGLPLAYFTPSGDVAPLMAGAFAVLIGVAVAVGWKLTKRAPDRGFEVRLRAEQK